MPKDSKNSTMDSFIWRLNKLSIEYVETHFIS